MKADPSRRWKFWFAATGAACIGLFLWSNAFRMGVKDLPAGALSGPIRIIPPEINCYHSQDQAKSIVVVTIKNDGLEVVNLLDVTASCGCTLPKLMPARTVQPGKSVELEIEVIPPGYGRRTSMVVVRTDAKDAPTIHVPIHLHGLKLNPPYISFAPADIRVDSIAGNASTTKTFEVTTIESPGMPWLIGFKTSSPSVVLRAPRLIKEEQLDGTTLLRNYMTEFVVPTSDSDHAFWLTPTTVTEGSKPSSPILVNALQVATIRAIPSSVVFSFGDDQSRNVRRIMLIPADEEEWEITSMDSGDPWLDVIQVIGKETSRNRQIEISAKAPSPSELSPKQSEIRIRTSHSKCPEIVVRVAGIRKVKSTGQPK